MRVARMMVITGASLAVLSGAGACTAATTAASAPAPVSSPAATSAPEGSAPAGTAPAASAPATSSPATKRISECAAADLRISLTGQPQRETRTTLMAMMLLENKSGRTCRLNGWPAVTLRNAANEVVPVPTSRVDQPGAPVTTDLKPGFSAAAGIKWTVCEKSDDACPVGNSLFVAPPNSPSTVPAELSGFPQPESSNITMKKLQIGSIQSSRQGVVAW
jgi:pyruvate/2-oxoglutarate dehydrogenase complex dihydrolipoamide acyltransferase (E2) component